MSESELEQEWIASGAHESFVSWLVSNLIQAREDIDTLASVDNQLWHDERNRGDTYHARAMALRRQAKAWRFTYRLMSDIACSIDPSSVKNIKRAMRMP